LSQWWNVIHRHWPQLQDFLVEEFEQYWSNMQRTTRPLTLAPSEALRLGKLACSAEVDDFENEFLGIELDPDLNAFADSSDEDGM
jgi:hypothetical protein